MNPSTELGWAIVSALIKEGVRDVVLSPGSRSAPIAIAAAESERAGHIRLFVRIDERGAGFLGVGLARASLRPAAVICTSGTAVANLLPAVTEASYSGVPLVCVTADRPPEMRGTGANQTIEQPGIFGRNVRFAGEIDSGSSAGTGTAEQAAAVVRMAVRAATDPVFQGPVHINAGLRDPLVPDPQDDFAAFARQVATDTGAGPLEGGEETRPSDIQLTDVLARAGLDRTPERGVIVLGDALRPDVPSQVSRLAGATGWPVLAEPSGNALGPNGICHFPLLLASRSFRERHRPDLVLTVGRFGLSRSTLAMVREARRHIAVAIGGRDVPDPMRTACAVVDAVPSVPAGRTHPGASRSDAPWLPDWLGAAGIAGDVIREALRGSGFSGIHVARTTTAAARSSDVVMLGPSRSVRDVQDYVCWSGPRPRAVGNRGASGIDGLISTAVGVAAGWRGRGRTFALIGDLAFLHDCNGLLAPAMEADPALTIVVTDNDGGGIFSSLEPGRPEHAVHFERVFGTPHGRDLVAIARSFGVASERVCDPAELAAALAERPARTRVVVARVQSRDAEAGLRERIARRVDAALASSLPGPMQGNDSA